LKAPGRQRVFEKTRITTDATKFPFPDISMFISFQIFIESGHRSSLESQSSRRHMNIIIIVYS
jgi:hypothetical protein